MSRSFKKEPVFGNRDHSEKNDKKRWHRVFRKKNKAIINKTKFDIDELQDIILPTEEDVSDPWLMSKDGKKYWNPKMVSEQVMQYFKKIMRK